MLIKNETSPGTVFDFRETAPRNLSQNLSLESCSFGGPVVGVPGELKGLFAAHAK